MVKYKVNWSIEAKQDLVETLEFYIERNGSAVYSKKLHTKIKSSANLLKKNPYLGVQTDCNSVKALITGDYQIIYEIFEETKIVLITMFWDSRRNPENKILGKRII